MKKNISMGLLTLAFTHAAFAVPNVISDIYPIQQIANAITGETTQVLVDSPMSPHNYKIKPSDIQRIEKADLVVRVSGQFVPNVSRYVQDDDPRVLDLLPLPELHKIQSTHHHEHGEHDAHHHDEDNEKKDEHADEHKHEDEHADEHKHEDEHADEHKHDEQEAMSIDKHIWLSPDNAKVIAKAISQRLGKLDPDNKAQYEENLAIFTQKIDAQKVKLSEKLTPIKDKPFIVFHDAYQYFEQAFGIEQTAMVRQDVSKGIRTKSFVMLEKALKDYDHVCVFKEPQFESTVVEQLGLNKNVSVASLDPIGFSKENTGYLKILDDIAESMATCLGKPNL